MKLLDYNLILNTNAFIKLLYVPKFRFFKFRFFFFNKSISILNKVHIYFQNHNFLLIGYFDKIDNFFLNV